MKIDKYTKKAIKATMLQTLIIYTGITIIGGVTAWDITYIPVETWKAFSNMGEWKPVMRCFFIIFYPMYFFGSIAGYKSKYKYD